MNRRILIFILLLPVLGCGYHVVQAPKLSVYVAPVENRSNRAKMGILVERAVENRLLQRGMTVADRPDSADVQVFLELTEGRKRTLQSGVDRRVTTSQEGIRLKALFQEKTGERTKRREFLLLNRYPTESGYYYNDSGREERELANQMGLQVVAWLIKP